jgi:polyisoprenoid-binding protein YceI
VGRIAAAAFSVLLAPGSVVATVEPEPFAVDTSASHVRIHLGRTGLLKFLGHDHEIDAPIAEGRVEVLADDPAHSSVRVRFEAARLAVVPGTEPAGDIPRVEARMRGPEVLDVERYPGIVFVSSAVAGSATEPGCYRLVVQGSLQLKGRSCPVEIRLEVRRAGGAIEAHGEIALKLRDLGIEPPSVAGVVNVANGFRVSFDIRARREGAATPRP